MTQGNVGATRERACYAYAPESISLVNVSACHRSMVSLERFRLFPASRAEQWAVSSTRCPALVGTRSVI